MERPEGRSELAGRAEEHLWSIDEHVGFSVDCGLPAPCEERERLWVRSAALCGIFFKRRSIRSVGLMDKASASGAGDSRFESWADQIVWKGGSVLVGYSDCAYAPSRFHVFIVEIKGKVRTRTHTSLLAYICAQVLPTSASSSRNHAISDLKKINMLS